MGTSCSATLSANIQHLQAPSAAEEQPDKQRLSEQLVEAARRGDAEAARRCLQEGAPPNSCDEHGWTPLHYAASQGESDICRLLLEFQGDANAAMPDLSTPLMLAV